MARTEYPADSVSPPVVVEEVGMMTKGRVWENYSEFLAHVAAGVENMDHRGNSYRKLTRTADLPEALRLAHDGWADQRTRVELLVSQVVESLGTITRVEPHRINAVAGSTVDIQRYLEGDLECMVDLTPAEVPAHGRVVRIAVRCNASYGVDPESIITRGAVIGAMVTACRLAGLSPEIWMEWTCTGMGAYRAKPVTYAVRVMEASQELDMDNVMFAVGHPSFCRRLMWQALDNDPLGDRWGARDYYGLNGAQGMQISTLGIEIDVEMDAPGGGYYPETRNPREFVLNTLRGIGVEVTD